MLARVKIMTIILWIAHMFFVLCMTGCATVSTSQKEDEAVQALARFRQNSSRGDNASSLSKIGAGDEVKVSVWRQDSLNKTFVVPPDGSVTFPLVGDLDVIGLTPFQLRDRIRADLKKYYSDPQVSVDITAAKSKRVYVLGEVNRPGVINIGSRMSALEAIAHAGGFTVDAKETSVLLVKGQSGDAGSPLRVLALDLKSAVRNGRTEENPLIDQGDVLYVLPSVIANVDRFFRRIYPLVESIVEAERGIVLIPEVNDIIRDSENGRTIILR